MRQTGDTETDALLKLVVDTAVAAAREAASSIVDQSRRLGLTWSLRPLTVNDGKNPLLVKATYDGDTAAPLEMVSMLGALPDGTRAYGLMVPPAGNFIIGYANDYPSGWMLRTRIGSIANSVAIGAVETAVLTANKITWRNGRAYRVIWNGRFDPSVSNVANIRVRRTDASGTQLGFFSEPLASTSGYNLNGFMNVVNISGADIIDNVALTLAASAGTVTMRGAADTVRFLEVWEIGTADDYPEAIQI